MLNQVQNLKLKLFQNKKKKTKIIALFLFLFLFPLSSLLSYNDTDTHPDLTVEIVKLYNLQSLENKLSNEEMELIRQGSIQEDIAPRWINHFYNPETGEGWTAKNLEGVSQKNMQTVSDWFLSSEKPVSSLNWAHNQELQNKYSFYQGNHTFQKAIYDYAKGKKEEGLKSLGHILHLIEDGSVPDHTRDDTHADISNIKDNADEGSPYEDWSENYTKNNNLNIAEELNNRNRKYYKCRNFDECLINLAKYSHYNFFSEDTIFEYAMPKIFREEKLDDRNYYYSENGYILAKSYEIENDKIYTLNDTLVMSSYWSLLSSEAVLTGAGIIETFFKEVEKTKNDPQYLDSLKFEEKELTTAQIAFAPAISLFADKLISPAGEYFRGATILESVKNFATGAFSRIKSLFENNIGSQQAGLPIIELNKSISDGIQNSETESQIRETVLETNETTLNQNVLRNSLNGRNEENEQNELNIYPRNAALESTQNPNSLIVNNQSRALGTKNSENQSVSQKDQSLNIQNGNGYSPGFGGGQAASFRSIKSGNDNFSSFANTSEDTQTNSNNQNQNSGTSTATSTNQNNGGNENQNSSQENQQNNASSTNQTATSTESNSQNNAENGVSNNNATSTNNDNQNGSSTENQIADTTSPIPPQIILPANLNQIFTTNQIVFSGTAEASSTLLAKSDFTSEATTSVSELGNWSLALFLSEGTTTVDFFAVDKAGNKSSSTSAIIFVDSIKPVINSFQIAECANSMSVQGESCLIATTTLTLIWTGDGEDLDSYELSWSSENPGTLSTAATSTVLTLNEGEHTFFLRAKDKSGNWSESTTTQAEISVMPVIINEIAWMGTEASGPDEWLELYNRTSKTVNLNNVVLYSEEMKPYIALSNSIAPYSYYLIERGPKDDAISDIPADLVVSFGNGLKGSKDESNGEPLYLVYSKNNSTTTFDYVPTCGATWCSGSGYFYKTMERVDPNVKGDIQDNWFSNIGYIKNGKDKNGKAIYGTPKTRNSANYLISISNTITKNTKLTKNNSPYFIYDNLTLPKDKSIAIEPGAVIKLLHPAYFFVEGNLEAIGNENNYITFTSFYDDEYGGDLDKNSGILSSSPGDWRQIVLLPTSSSTISYSRFRYGGSPPTLGGTGSMIKILSSSSTVSNSIFEYSKGYGLELTGVNTSVSNSIFQNNNSDNYSSFGLYAENGSPKILSNNFSKNRRGINLVNSDADVELNNFTEHTAEPIYAFTDKTNLPVFKNNFGDLNLKNGIFLKGITLKENSVSTAYANPTMPYILDSSDLTLNASSTLTIESGSVFKSTNARINIFGNLETKGNGSGDIVFTSLNDYAGDWYGIQVNPGAKVVLSGATVKQGGKNSGEAAGLYAYGADVSADNVLFEDNLNNGLVLKNSKSAIKNSEFKNHNLGNAVAYYNSEINLDNASFRNNWMGVYADSASVAGAIFDNLFKDNASSTNRLELFL